MRNPAPQPDSCPDAAEEYWRTFRANPYYLHCLRAWREAVRVGREGEFLERAWPYMRDCLRYGTLRPVEQGLDLTLLCISLASGDLGLLEQIWESSSRNENFWFTVHARLIVGGGSVIAGLAPLALDLGLDRLVPGPESALVFILNQFCSEVHDKWLGEWHLEWQRKFVVRHADKPEFAEAVRTCLINRI